jgi:DNA-binding HxlR family transcriptional regulator
MIGKKWSYPLICIFEKSSKYSFEEIVRLTNRKVHRAKISEFLKVMSQIGLLSVSEGKYYITNKGMKVQSLCARLSFELLHGKSCPLLKNPIVGQKE